MKLCNLGNRFDYEMEKLIRLYLPFEKIEVFHRLEAGDRLAVCAVKETNDGAEISARLSLGGTVCEHKKILKNTIDDFEKECELALAGLLSDCFYDLTGYRPEWGILTGVRPARLFRSKIKQLGARGAEKYFSEVLRVSAEKIELCRAAAAEDAVISLSRPDSFSLYLSVPFCPTRCSYCSFVSHSVAKAGDLIPKYVDMLCTELRYTADIAASLGLRLETVYMGGGTPTVLSEDQLEAVLNTVNTSFDLSHCREFTVEAGRPDTVTKAKLETIKSCGADRISINPQTLNDDVLKTIGRAHTASQFEQAFSLAREIGFKTVNTDLIAGLPSESVESFKTTIEKIIGLNPESVTVHSLSMKRASELTEKGLFPEIDAGKTAGEMVRYARLRLTRGGIYPYYLYRQSKTVGNLENVGYSKPGHEGLYNIYIMDETHTVLACGASAVTKLRNPYGQEIKRIFNFKYPYEYISKFDELIKRKSEIAGFYKGL